MALYLLDSDAIIDYLNRYSPTISMLRELVTRDDTLCTCGIVVAEVYAGLRPAQEELAKSFLSTLGFLSDSPVIAERAGSWRYAYGRQGRSVPLTDAMIAAAASESHATILTGNVRDYPMPEVSVLPLPR